MRWSRSGTGGQVLGGLARKGSDERSSRAVEQAVFEPNPKPVYMVGPV